MWYTELCNNKTLQNKTWPIRNKYSIVEEATVANEDEIGAGSILDEFPNADTNVDDNTGETERDLEKWA